MTGFNSIFAVRIEGFLEYRIARGFKCETYLRHLIRFDHYCSEHHSDLTVLTRELVHEWIDGDLISSQEMTKRAATVRQFGKYLVAIDEDAYILPDRYAPVKSWSMPYIFTDSELAALFAAIDKLPATKSEPFLNEMLPTLFRLTYTCGLRPNESRELLRKNVDFGTGEILITHTKHNKERYIVMSDDMLKMVRDYDIRRNVIGGDSSYFFPSVNGNALKTETVYSAFNRAWSRSLPSGSMPHKVRVYDLRHRMASACLNNWLDTGENLMAMLPYLRTYMGHCSLIETAYYIHILPENIVKSSAIDWDKFNAMFPELTPEREVSV
jgi:integrase